MANKKIIRRANARFASSEPRLYGMCKYLCSSMASFIRRTGASEVTVGITKYGGYYEWANN